MKKRVISAVIGAALLGASAWSGHARAEVVGTYGEGWAEINNGLKTLHLKGTEREMGRQYGYLVADEVEDTLNILREVAIKQEPKVRLLPKWAFRGIRRFIGWIWWQTFPKNIKDHLDGIIEGGKLRPNPVKLTHGDLGFMNGIIDTAALFRAGADSIESQNPKLEELAGRTLLKLLGLGGITTNCDTFAAWGSRTEGGKTFQTRNVDVPTGQGLESHPLVVIYKPEGKIPFATAAFSGIVGMFTGLNAEGVGMGQVWAFSKNNTVTAPWQLQMREVMMHSRTAAEARDRMMAFKKLTYGNNFVLAGPTPGDAFSLEGNSKRLAWFGANDPKESELKLNGEPLNIPLEEAVLRGDMSFDPEIRKSQNACNGPDGDPRTSNAYKKRYKGQADLILEYESKGIKIGKEQAERISRDTAMRNGSLQAAVYANTDRELWVAYARMNADGTVTQAYEREYVHVPFYQYLLDRRPADTRYEIRVLRDGRAIEAGRWATGYSELQQEIADARSRSAAGDLVEVLGEQGQRLELERVGL